MPGLGTAIGLRRRAAGGTPPPVPPAPVAAFSGTPLSGEAPLTVAFTDLSTNTPAAWTWERNDGSGWSVFSGSQSPSAAFAIGTWDVRLTAGNAGGSDAETKLAYLSVTAPSPPPPAAGTPLGLLLALTVAGTSPPPPYTPSLDFGDSRNSQYEAYF